MACAPEETLSPELLALEKNSSNLCRGITSISTVTDFALLLVEQSFITPVPVAVYYAQQGSVSKKSVIVFWML